MSLIFLALFIVCIDQLLKLYFLRIISPGQSIPLIRDFFHITLVENSGAAFGIFKNQTSLFIILSFTAIAFIIYSLPRLNKTAHLSKMALVMILGGAVSNLIDRIRFGYVIDYLDFRIWPVFNIADSFISIGAILFIIQLIRKNKVT